MRLLPRRSGRSMSWFLLAVLAAVGVWWGYKQWRQAVARVDPVLMGELQNAVLAAPVAAESNDWPQWRGPRRDGLSLETGLLDRWPEAGPKLVWQAPVGAGYSALAVADGRAITLFQDGDSEAVVCWDAETGKERWRFRYPCRYVNDFGNGPRSTPTISGDLIFAVGATGMMHCLKADTGEKVWVRDLLRDFGAENLQWGVSFSPLVEGGLVYTNPGGPNGRSLAAFHKADGKLAWAALDDVAGYSSPIAVTAAGKRQVVFFTGKRLVGVDPVTGSLLWSYPWETDYDANIATPIAVGDYLFISSGYDRGCALLKVVAEQGTFRIQRVYENTHMRNHFASCVYYNEHLYGFDEATLTCMEFRSGTVRWRERGFRKGSLTIADGKLFVLSENGRLALADASPEAYRERSSYRFSHGKCWTVPVLCRGKLYLRDEEKVVCLDVKKP
ncbi:MAG: PQQ-like beta-propeller repeat protein [Gemmataceae bacterium]|nr:PQQ-like beta-propeller repeat protein [Gemmataceae bacterium]MDW8266347.1 PQQ-binding-like beta-propeller repeat protein [Gemmataceae bacterium]